MGVHTDRGSTGLPGTFSPPAHTDDATLSRRSFMKLGAGLLVTMAGVSLSGCEWGDATFRGEKTIVDDWGREVVIPSANVLERVYFTSALASIFCFTLAPDLIAGAAQAYSQEALEYLPERMSELTVLGSVGGAGEIDRETLMREDIQLIFSVSSIELTQENHDEAVALQEATDIPVVLVDGSDMNLSHAYSLIGECLGVEDRAEELAGYCAEIYEFVTGVAASVPDDQKKRFYYAEGPLGLQTEARGSQHALAMETVGGMNVCDLEILDATGMMDVDFEQVLLWNPDYIIATATANGGCDEHVRTNSRWQDIAAVQEGRVYAMPYIPFNWCDRPAAVNRYLGMHWTTYLFYPEQYCERYDIVQEVKSFYSRFYWREITDEEAKTFLGASYQA